MAEITGSIVKSLAKDWGADIVGIASVDRFERAPPGHGPQDLMPESRSVIVAGIRIPDPIVDYDRYHLKMEEMPSDIAIGASVHNLYMLMGHHTIDVMLNTLAIRLANKLEINWGLKALPTPNTIKTGLGHPAHGVSMGFFSQRHAATRAGLGEFGFNNIVITPQFGPRVRFVSIITEAELEPDPLIEKKICLREKCGGKDGPICFQRCAGGALRLRAGIAHDAIFIDTPTELERSLCSTHAGDLPENKCVFNGTCLRVCPIGMKVTKRSPASR